MENLPKVYIGIPTINRPQFVGETIDSVLGQTFTDFEVTVSDNCSAEDAAESVRHYVESRVDDRIKFHAQPTNVGEYGQGRFFFKQAQHCDYFIILHDDDVLESNYLKVAVDTLEKYPKLSFFIANPYVMDESGTVSSKGTRKYLAHHGRNKVMEGEFEALDNYLKYGFSPVSGTVFRVAALRKSGFVSDDGIGNFPFECDLFLKMGDIRAKAWFAKKQLLGFRFHRMSMRNYMNILKNRDVVERMIKLFAQRQYSDILERRRKMILCRLYRALALINLCERKTEESRSNVREALRMNKTSPKTWMVAPLLFLAPNILRSLLPGLPENLIAPNYSDNTNGN